MSDCRSFKSSHNPTPPAHAPHKPPHNPRIILLAPASSRLGGSSSSSTTSPSPLFLVSLFSSRISSSSNLSFRTVRGSVSQNGVHATVPSRSTSDHTSSVLKSSMNCWSTARDLGAEKRRYLRGRRRGEGEISEVVADVGDTDGTDSSKVEVRDQDWRRRRQPTRQPVRCCRVQPRVGRTT